MNYIELTIQFETEDSVQKEILTADLIDFGFESFAEEDKIIKAYLPQDGFNDVEVAMYLKKYPDVTFVSKTIEQQNWNEEWEKDYQPIIFEDKCIVGATFHQIEKKYPVEIIIDPKMSFGTGHHETTFLMVSEMFKLDFRNKTVLDMGTGTGILAILASKLGAGCVTAIDNDEWSYTNSIENTKKNNANNVNIILGDASAIPSKKYDFILANINRNTLLANLTRYTGHARQNSTIVLSGIYKIDIEALNSEANKQGLVFENYREKNNWVVIKYKKT